MKRRRLVSLVISQACLLLFLALVGHAQSADWRVLTPLPDDLKIDPPGPGVPAAVAGLSGVWQGALAC